VFPSLQDGWNPINDIESVIVSVRSLLPVGNGRLEAAVNLPDAKYEALLKAAQEAKSSVSSRCSTGIDEDEVRSSKRSRKSSDGDDDVTTSDNNKDVGEQQQKMTHRVDNGGAYSVSEAQAAYAHLSDYHKKKGWDISGWWASKG
jgi:ubiquitin-conjugating enzyme E2 Q